MNPWLSILDKWGILLTGFVNTLTLTIMCIVASTVVGFLYAVIRYYRVPGLSQVVRLLMEVFRGSPLLIQLLFIYYGLAFAGVQGVTVLAVCVLTITLYQGAYISEVFRAGLESVGKGQREASRTLGLNEFTTMTSVILPQSMRVALAPLFGQYVALVKHTALASVIGYTDLLRFGKAIIDVSNNPFEVYLVVGILYFILSYPLSLVALHLEKKALKF